MTSRATILLAKSGLAAAAVDEMSRYARYLAQDASNGEVAFAFSELGEPGFRDVFFRLRDAGCDEIVIVPLLVPMEPNFLVWLPRTLRRWQAAAGVPWPTVRVGTAPFETGVMETLISAMAGQAAGAPPVEPLVPTPEGSVVPAQKHRVLVCGGGTCDAAGGALVWGHFRRAQVARNLRAAGDGVMSAKTSCLGPCNLAPVLQVMPEGTYYGGVTEADVDRIIDEHLMSGRVVEDLAYVPSDGKAYLRER